MIRLATESENKNWNQLLAKNPAASHIYQSREWGEYKNDYGWRPLRLIFEDTSSFVALQLLARNVRGMGRVYYCPKGPAVFADFKADQSSLATFKKLTSELKKFLTHQDKKALLLMIEPEVLEGELDLRQFGYQKSKRDLQFKATIIVDISLSEADLLTSFKQKTRYNINLARRRHVKIAKRPADSKMIDTMYALMKATQSRAGFFLRPKAAFAKYWQGLAKADLGQFLVATHEGEVLSAVYVMIFGSRAYYKEGGSFDLKRNLMAPHLLQYEAMLWAKSHGATSYDLIGVPPPDKLAPNHHLFSLYQFKSGFNPAITEFVGCYDLILNKRAKIWLRAERYYNSIYARIKKNLFY